MGLMAFNSFTWSSDKKGNYNKMTYFLSQTPTTVIPILELCCANYDTWKDQYATDLDFQNIWGALHRPMEIN